MNGVQITANLKGLKKKPGTAPPPDITKLVKLNGHQNRVEMVYVNSQQPVHKVCGRCLSSLVLTSEHTQKFYLVVQLVEVSSVEAIVERIRKGKFRSREEVLITSGFLHHHGFVQKLTSYLVKRDATQQDDDIEIGPQKMSLKCPVRCNASLIMSELNMCS